MQIYVRHARIEREWVCGAHPCITAFRSSKCVFFVIPYENLSLSKANSDDKKQNQTNPIGPFPCRAALGVTRGAAAGVSNPQNHRVNHPARSGARPRRKSDIPAVLHGPIIHHYTFIDLHVPGCSPPPLLGLLLFSFFYVGDGNTSLVYFPP